MPLYITLLNYTEQGVKTLREAPQRVAAARQAVEKAGGKLHSYHLTMGQHDAVVIAEAPSDEAYATLILSIAAQGNIRSTTLKAFTEEESFRIFDNLP